MRTIKFRFWNTISGKMINDPKMPFKEGWTIEQLFSDRGWVWQQFTGLTDKNGKEIYEGDILKNTKENIIVSVIWDVSGAGWQFNEYMDFDDGVGRGDWRLTIGFAKNCEVIGNIYENQELLK